MLNWRLGTWFWLGKLPGRADTRYRIKWEDEEYQVVGQPTLVFLYYTVKSIAGGRPRVLHRNLLLPLQGRISEGGGVGEEGTSDSEDEEGRRGDAYGG